MQKERRNLQLPIFRLSPKGAPYEHHKARHDRPPCAPKEDVRPSHEANISVGYMRQLVNESDRP